MSFDPERDCVADMAGRINGTEIKDMREPDRRIIETAISAGRWYLQCHPECCGELRAIADSGKRGIFLLPLFAPHLKEQNLNGAEPLTEQA